MKRVICFLFLFFSLPIADAQNPNFLRLYNSKGKKINKGELFQTSDTSITLTRKNTFNETPITQLHLIKTNRTTGRRILITTLSVAGVVVILAGALLSLSQPNGQHKINKKKSRYRERGNSITKPPRPQKRHRVNQDLETWRKQREILNWYLY